MQVHADKVLIYMITICTYAYIYIDAFYIVAGFRIHLLASLQAGFRTLLLASLQAGFRTHLLASLQSVCVWWWRWGFRTHLLASL